MLNRIRCLFPATALLTCALLACVWPAQAQRPPKNPPKASNAPDDNGYSLPEGPKLHDKTE